MADTEAASADESRGGPRQAPRRDRSSPPPPPARVSPVDEEAAAGVVEGVEAVADATTGDAPAREGGGRRRRHRSRRRERQAERAQQRDGADTDAEADDHAVEDTALPASVFAATPAIAVAASIEQGMHAAHPPATQQPLAAALHSPSSEPVAYESPVTAAQAVVEDVAAPVASAAPEVATAAEPVVAETSAVAVEPVAAPAAEETAETVAEAPAAVVAAPAMAESPVAPPAAEPLVGDDGRPRRAANDPREIRRRQQEEAMRAAQGTATTDDNA